MPVLNCMNLFLANPSSVILSSWKKFIFRVKVLVMVIAVVHWPAITLWPVLCLGVLNAIAQGSLPMWSTMLIGLDPTMGVKNKVVYHKRTHDAEKWKSIYLILNSIIVRIKQTQKNPSKNNLNQFYTLINSCMYG